MADGKIICIAGIDTDIGKTIVTGLIARYLHKQGKSVITQKLSQTGCENQSEDILVHRKIMGIELVAEDKNGLTCPYIFPQPCSPHLAAKLVGKKIDIEKIRAATTSLASKYEYVLLEGVGGLMVPITERYTLLDYLESEGYPVILVTSPKLGSINHTILSLEALYNRGLPLVGIVYNCYTETSDLITEDSKEIFKIYSEKYGYEANIIEIPHSQEGQSDTIDFSCFF